MRLHSSAATACLTVPCQSMCEPAYCFLMWVMCSQAWSHGLTRAKAMRVLITYDGRSAYAHSPV